VHVIFWNLEVFGHFSKNLHVGELSHFSSMFWIDGTYFVQSTLLTPLGWHSSNFVQLLWTHWRSACDFLEDYRHSLKKLHVIELSNFSSMFWINCIYCHQLITFTIKDKSFRAIWPFLFLNRFIFLIKRQNSSKRGQNSMKFYHSLMMLTNKLIKFRLIDSWKRNETISRKPWMDRWKYRRTDIQTSLSYSTPHLNSGV
jgi:hypothetical protein